LEDIFSKNLAFEAYRNGKYQDALPTLSALADQGDVDALLALAWVNESGATGSQNLELAKLCYQRAADLGSSDALYRLGRILRKSNDLPGALAAFERGAKQEYLPCISALGTLLVRTASNPDQTRVGMRWLNDAAARGHFFARKEILKLDLEIEYSFSKLLRISLGMILLGIGYNIERRMNKYSPKIL
jgi:TPR repeat protein